MPDSSCSEGSVLIRAPALHQPFPPWCLWWWCVQRSMQRKVTGASLLPSSISFSFYKWDGREIAEHLLIPLCSAGPGDRRERHLHFTPFTLPQQGANDEKQWDSSSAEVFWWGGEGRGKWSIGQGLGGVPRSRLAVFSPKKLSPSQM